MKCPKCGSKHIRPDGSCLICGMYVAEEQIPERQCFCCARKLPIIGDTCPECETAIKLGAKALVKGRLKNRKSDKEIVAATCPALEPLEVLYQKFHARREKHRAYSLAYKNRNRERIRADGREYYRRNVDAIIAQQKAYRKTEEYREYARKRRSTDEHRAWERAYRAKRYQEDAAYRERKREKAKEYRARKRAEFLALPEEEQKALRAAHRASDAYKRQLKQNQEYRARVMADPERAAKFREQSAVYWSIPKNRQRRIMKAARYRALKRLIRENDKLDRERQQMEVKSLYERQWEAFGAEDCGNQGAVRGDSLRGNNAGESELGVVVNGRVCAA